MVSCSEAVLLPRSTDIVDWQRLQQEREVPNSTRQNLCFATQRLYSCHVQLTYWIAAKAGGTHLHEPAHCHHSHRRLQELRGLHCLTVPCHVASTRAVDVLCSIRNPAQARGAAINAGLEMLHSDLGSTQDGGGAVICCVSSMKGLKQTKWCI